MNDQIAITGIKAHGFHGVFPEERRVGQDFIVDVLLFLDLNSAGESDDLTKTVDYSKVAELVVAQIKGEPLNLIEALAMRIIKHVLSDFPLVQKVKVVVHKPSAPVDVKFQDILVTLERSR